MKKVFWFGLSVICIVALAALILGPVLRGAQEEPVLEWYTYAGSSVDDQGWGIARDPSGNIYFVGWSDATWGSPINLHSGGRDAFVAKLNSIGELQWNTFLGSSLTDEGSAIAVDSSGMVYVMGTSEATWGVPVIPYSGQSAVFVAKLNSDGEIIWNLFIGGAGGQHGDIAVDVGGSIYVTGVTSEWNDGIWGTLVNPPAGGWDAFVVKLNSSGNPQWHTFIGGQNNELGTGIAVDTTGHVYVSGRAAGTWGTPVNEHNGNGFEDGFAAKLDSSGNPEWHTFFGGAGTDEAYAIAVDASSNVHISGHSTTGWGVPIAAHSEGGWDGFVVKLDSSGIRQWLTFLGVSMGWDLAVAGGQNVYVTGVGRSYCGYIAALNGDGALQWNLPIEGCLEGIALDGSGNFWVAGRSGSAGGTPVNPPAGGWDAFVAKISILPTYVFYGFDRPIDNQPTVNNAKAGSVIPVKWRITDLDGIPISDPASFQSLTSNAISCGSLSIDPVDELEEYSPGSSGLQYLGDGYWQFNWKTPKSYAGQCRIMVLTLADQSTYTANFSFK